MIDLLSTRKKSETLKMLKALLSFALAQQTACFMAPSLRVPRSVPSPWITPRTPQAPQLTGVVLHARRDKGSLAPPAKRENTMVMNEQIKADPVRVVQAASSPGEADVALGIMSLAEVRVLRAVHTSLLVLFLADLYQPTSTF